MTKEEIAYKATNFIFDEYELGITGLANAMEIYAKQEAIAFAKFAMENTLQDQNAVRGNSWDYENGHGNFEQKTDDELYQLYLKSKTQE